MRRQYSYVRRGRSITVVNTVKRLPHAVVQRFVLVQQICRVIQCGEHKVHDRTWWPRLFSHVKVCLACEVRSHYQLIILAEQDTADDAVSEYDSAVSVGLHFSQSIRILDPIFRSS